MAKHPAGLEKPFHGCSARAMTVRQKPSRRPSSLVEACLRSRMGYLVTRVPNATGVLALFILRGRAHIPVSCADQYRSMSPWCLYTRAAADPRPSCAGSEQTSFPPPLVVQGKQEKLSSHTLCNPRWDNNRRLTSRPKGLPIGCRLR